VISWEEEEEEDEERKKGRKKERKETSSMEMNYEWVQQSVSQLLLIKTVLVVYK
jgi:hypothetical protein